MKVKEKIEIVGIVVGIISTLFTGVYFLYDGTKNEPGISILSTNVFQGNTYPKIEIVLQNESDVPQYINSLEFDFKSFESKYHDDLLAGDPVVLEYNWLLNINDAIDKTSEHVVDKVIDKGEVVKLDLKIGFEELRYKTKVEGFINILYGKGRQVKLKRKFELIIDNGLLGVPYLELPDEPDSLLRLLSRTKDNYSRVIIINKMSEFSYTNYYDVIEKDLQSQSEKITVAALNFIEKNPVPEILPKTIKLALAPNSSPLIKRNAFDIMKKYPITSLRILEGKENNELTKYYSRKLKDTANKN